jgi:molybdenum cofactor cytidylyltransferase
MGCLLKGGGGLHSRVVIGAVLLAAGSASRMGGRPKCLLELGGVPLIRRQIVALSGAGVDELVVVTGHYAQRIEPVVQDFPVTLVRNPDPDAGQPSSQRIGLAALGGKLDAVIVALADQPLLNAQDITGLIGAWKKRAPGIEVVYPQVNGERGNPVIMSAAVREQVLAAAPGYCCRAWQREHPEGTAAFVTDNRRYRVDVDTPEDLARFEQQTGHALRWPAALA